MNEKVSVQYRVTDERTPSAVILPSEQTAPLPPEPASGPRVEKYKRRHWAAYDVDGKLICICVYQKGTKRWYAA
jgi:hypothetical protein